MKISSILTSKIGRLSKELAGTENVYLNDLKILQKSFNVTAFSRFNNQKPSVSKVYYPLFLAKFGNFLKVKTRLKKFERLISFIAETVYFIQILARSVDSDLILSYSAATAALLPLKNRVIFIHTYIDFYLPKVFYKSYKSSFYIFCSKYLRDYYINNYDFINKENSAVLYNAIDKKDFYKIRKNKKDNSKVNLLYVSAWVKQKGLHILLEAYSRLPKKLKRKIRLTIASSPNLWYIEKFDVDQRYQQKIESLISQNPEINLLKGVRHLDMNSLYNKNDYLIFPSTWGEPCSVSLIEASFSGLPVVAYNVGGNLEILNRKNSIILTSKSIPVLSKNLAKIANGELHAKSSFRFIKEDFYANVRTEKFRKLIRDISKTSRA